MSPSGPRPVPSGSKIQPCEAAAWSYASRHAVNSADPKVGTARLRSTVEEKEERAWRAYRSVERWRTHASGPYMGTIAGVWMPHHAFSTVSGCVGSSPRLRSSASAWRSAATDAPPSPLSETPGSAARSGVGVSDSEAVARAGR